MAEESAYCVHIEATGIELPDWAPEGAEEGTLYIEAIEHSTFSIILKILPDFKWGIATCLRFEISVDGLVVRRFCCPKAFVQAKRKAQQALVVDVENVSISTARDGDSISWYTAKMRFSPIGGHLNGNAMDLQHQRKQFGKIKVECHTCVHNPDRAETKGQPVVSVDSIATTPELAGDATHIVTFEDVQPTDVPLPQKSLCRRIHYLTTRVRYRSAEAIRRLGCRRLPCHCRDEELEDASAVGMRLPSGTFKSTTSSDDGEKSDEKATQEARDELRRRTMVLWAQTRNIWVEKARTAL